MCAFWFRILRYIYLFIHRFDSHFLYAIQLVEAYKVMESERNNLQQLLASHQTKTSKSVDEMYKKLELDKQTKDQLERDFRQLLSEKEEIIKSLRLQVC